MKGLQTVLPEIAHDQEVYNDASREAIDIMQKYGSSLDDTMTAARSFGRMYKEVETVMGLVNNATLLNVIDQVALEDAVKGNEVALSTYGDALKSTNEVLAFSGHLMDSITNLSHNTLATGTDLVNILQQTASAAKQADTDLDKLLGTGAAAIRATGLQGQGGNIGRALRTVFTQLSAPTKAVEEEINDIGVSLRDLDTGKLRSAYDIILDLSLATQDAKLSQEELNEALLKAASGKFQYNKLSALVGQFDDIVKNTAMSLNSQGLTLEMAAQQLDTISRKAGQVRATLIDLFSGVGDSGLRETIKDMLDVVNQFIMGLNNMDKAQINSALQIGAMVLAGRLLIGVFRGILPMMTGLVSGVIKLGSALQTAATLTEALTLAISGLNIATKGLAGVISAGLSVGTLAAAASFMKEAYAAGEAEKKITELTAAQEANAAIVKQKVDYYTQETSFLQSMAEKHKQLTEALNKGNLSEEQRATLQRQLTTIQEAVVMSLDEETKAKIDLNNITDATIAKIIELLNTQKTVVLERAKLELADLQTTYRNTQEFIKYYQARIAVLRQYAALKGDTAVASGFASGTFNPDKPLQNSIYFQLKDAEQAIVENEQLAAYLLLKAQEAEKNVQAIADSLSAPGGHPGGGGSSDGGDSKKTDAITEYLQALADATDKFDLINAQLEASLDAVNQKLSVAGAEYDYLNGKMESGVYTAEEWARAQQLITIKSALLSQEQDKLAHNTNVYQDEIAALTPVLAEARAAYEEYNEAGDSDHAEEAAKAVSKLQGKIDDLSGSIASNTQKLWENKSALDGLKTAAYDKYYQNLVKWMEHIGHMVDIIDSDLNIDVQVRIIKYKYNVFQPWLCELDVGDPIEKIQASIANTVKMSEFIKTNKGNTGLKNLFKAILDTAATQINGASGDYTLVDGVSTWFERIAGVLTGKLVRITPAGMLISSDGGQSWNTAIDGDGVYADQIICTALYALASGDGFTKMTDSGLEVWDDSDPPVKRVHIGQYALGAFGAKVLNGAIYGTLFKTGDPDATSKYVEISTDVNGNGYIRVVGENGHTTVKMDASQSTGRLGLYDNEGNESAYLFVSGGTEEELLVRSILNGIHISNGSDRIYVGPTSGDSGQGVGFTFLKGSLLPLTTNTGAVGNAANRWNSGYISYLIHGDLGFGERTCAICGQELKSGDTLGLIVKEWNEACGGTLTVPIHLDCKDTPATITLEVPEVAIDYALGDDGELIPNAIPAYETMEVEVITVNPAYTLDKTTGQFYRSDTPENQQIFGEEAIRAGVKASKKVALCSDAITRQVAKTKTITFDVNGGADPERIKQLRKKSDNPVYNGAN